MKPRVDSCFFIGRSHDVCEDYATHQVFENGVAAFAVSDGCSSAVDVDFGSRILCKKALEILSEDDFLGDQTLADFHFSFIDELMARADDSRRSLGLPEESLYATLLVGVVSNHNLLLLAYGDGHIMVKTRNGTVDRYDIGYTANAPLYPAYNLHPGHVKQFLKDFPGNEKRISLELGGSGHHDVIVKPVTEPFHMTWEVADVDYCFVTTDGFDSFVDRAKMEKLAAGDFIADALTLKNTAGGFAKRRMKSFFRGLSKTDIAHDDDIGVAGVCFDRQ